MTEPESPLKRPISIDALIVGLLGLFAVVAVVAALVARRIGLVIAAVVFLAAAAIGSYLTRRTG